MSNEDAHAIGTIPALAALETAATAAMAVDGTGEIVWTNAAGRPLAAKNMLDDAVRRAVSRIAASGSEGLARLRVGDGDRAEALTFRCRRIKLGEGARGVLLETLSPVDFPLIDTTSTEPDHEIRDVAAEEGAHPSETVAETALDRGLEALDPRRSLSPAEHAEPTEQAETPVAENVADEEPDTASEPQQTGIVDDGRFVFETDGDGRIAFLSADLKKIVGSSAASAIGRGWDEVSSELRLDPEGAVAAALAGRGGWSDLPISWPTEDGRHVQFALSALPMFDRGRTFVGFRGLGHLLAPTPFETRAEEPATEFTELAAQQAEAPAPTISPVADGEPAPATSLLESLAGLSVIGAPAALGPFAPRVVSEEVPLRADADLRETQPEIAADPVEPSSDDQKILSAPASERSTEELADVAPVAVREPLKIVDALREEPPAIVSVPTVIETYPRNVVPLRESATQPARGLPPAALSTVEESAFDEIARRLRGLGARVSDTPDLPHTAGAETAEIRPTPETRDWTLDDVEGRAPTASRADDAFRLLDRLPIGALVLRAGEVAYANRAALDMAGHRDLKSLVERGSADLFAEALPRDDAAPSSLRLRAQDGLEVDVEARLSTISWNGGPATLVALKRAEALSIAATDALQREREVSEILDTATDGVLTIDSAGRILSVNRSAEALFGFDEASVIGSLFTLSLAPESRRAAYDYLDSLKANGVGAILNDGREVLGLARQGGAIPLYMTMGRIGAPQEGRYCAVLRDITHWKKAEEELLAAKRQAERANAQKSEFLARVSHEIRTPLNAIIGFSEVMMEERLGPIGNPRYKDYLRDIHVSGEHLTGLVNDLLDLSKVESGLLKLEFASVDLNEIVSQAAALLQAQANRDHVIIRTSLARNLPSVLADRRSARQIMTNLVSNAVKFSRPGGQVIVATAYTDGGQAVVRVRDAGAGMSKKDITGALEPFGALPSADGDSGSGIGLPLTKALIEANEAAFDIQSELGEGTLVEVTFPPARVLAG